MSGRFPIDTSEYKPLILGPGELTNEQAAQLRTNTDLKRDIIVLMTGLSAAKGLGGHTGGAYDVVPETEIIDGLIRGHPDRIHPAIFDEAGHRVAVDYVSIALDERVPEFQLEDTLRYREHGGRFPLTGHSELGLTPGITHSSGRLGHIASFVNGVAEREHDKKVFMRGSDGAQQEGNNAEAARYAAANNLNVVWVIDKNDVTIEGDPRRYMNKFDIAKTLGTAGFEVFSAAPEIGLEGHIHLDYEIKNALNVDGPSAVVVHRRMAPGLPVDDKWNGHDAIPAASAIGYLKSRGHEAAADMIVDAMENKPVSSSREYLGSRGSAKNRVEFGRVVAEILRERPDDLEKILVISSDLGGSCGLAEIEKEFPSRYRKGGAMERNNFLAAAGFGSKPGYQGVFATFSAFSEMLISEITMARLNKANVLAHFSHAGVDDMSDGTCHYGTNIFFIDNGLPEGDNTRLYAPADAHQMGAIVRKIFPDPGLRVVISTRAPNPFILTKAGNEFFAPSRYTFTPGKDEVIREGSDGYVVTHGNMLYRVLDVVDSMEDISIGVINKSTLNVVDEKSLEKTGSSGFVLVATDQRLGRGLDAEYAAWLEERGYSPVYGRMGVTRPGVGGQSEQIDYQGLSTGHVKEKLLELHAKVA